MSAASNNKPIHIASTAPLLLLLKARAFFIVLTFVAFWEICQNVDVGYGKLFYTKRQPASSSSHHTIYLFSLFVRHHRLFRSSLPLLKAPICLLLLTL